MKKYLNETNQYVARYGNEAIQGTVYALKKLGVERSHCFLKIDNHSIPCLPFSLGLKRSILLAPISRREMDSFQKYTNSVVAFCLALNPEHKPEPVNFYLHCSLSTIGQMKDWENVALFVVDYKTSPDEMIRMLGKYLEEQELIRIQYDDYGRTMVKMTPETARLMGYNFFSTITSADMKPRRIHLMGVSSKSLEHIETDSSFVLTPGTPVSYQLSFNKYHLDLQGHVNDTERLPQNLTRIVSTLEFCPELVEIIDDFWYNFRACSTKNVHPELNP